MTSWGHRDRRVLPSTVLQAHRSHPASLQEQPRWPLYLTRFSPSASQPDRYLPREYWEKLVADAGFGPSLNLRDCSWPYVLLMRLGMHMLELLVRTAKVPRNILNPRLESKLVPVLYHIYSFRSSGQVSLGLGALGLSPCVGAGPVQGPCFSLLPGDTQKSLWFHGDSVWPQHDCCAVTGWPHALPDSSPNPLLLTFSSPGWADKAPSHLLPDHVRCCRDHADL